MSWQAHEESVWRRANQSAVSNATEELNNMKTEDEGCQWIWQDGISDFNNSDFKGGAGEKA